MIPSAQYKPQHPRLDFLGKTACLIGVHFEEGFILLDIVDLDKDVTFFCCQAGEFCFGVGFVFVDEVIFPFLVAFC